MIRARSRTGDHRYLKNVDEGTHPNIQPLQAVGPISRWQRDLTDSTVIRNLGVPLAHTRIASASLQRGLDKLILNEEALQQDLEKNWAVVAEGIQTILRREGYPNPYEALLALEPASVSCVDGFRLSFAEGWLLVRPSGTEPVLRVYAEGRSPEMVRALLDYGEEVAEKAV